MVKVGGGGVLCSCCAREGVSQLHKGSWLFGHGDGAEVPAESGAAHDRVKGAKWVRDLFPEHERVDPNAQGFGFVWARKFS